MFSKKIVVKIDGMHCSHCAERVKKSLGEIANVKAVKVNLDKKNATVSYKDSIDLDSVKKNIEELEFKYLGVE